MKPGTFTQLYIHLVFSPKFRECLLNEKFSNELHSYIGGTLKGKGHKPIIINSMPDHIHILLGLNPNITISDTVGNIKKSSSRLINEKLWLHGHFSWQDGYGAFSYGRSQLDEIYKYIENQQTHHKRFDFREEYMTLLTKFEIEFEDQYLFEFFD